jgi:hypothetical protein
MQFFGYSHFWRRQMTDANIEKYIRVPMKLEELFEIPRDVLDDHQLYVAHETGKMKFYVKDTIVYLDEPVAIDDETDEEIYPAFVLKNNLEMDLSGQLVNDVIDNTKHQLNNPTIDDFIVNLNYYNHFDCFFTFKEYDQESNIICSKNILDEFPNGWEGMDHFVKK